MKDVIIKLLLHIVEDLNTGNSNITDEEALKIAKTLKKYTKTDTRFSKYSACKYLKMSRATFDTKVRKGEIPRGIHEQGFKELYWTKESLDKYKKSAL